MSRRRAGWRKFPLVTVAIKRFFISRKEDVSSRWRDARTKKSRPRLKKPPAAYYELLPRHLSLRRKRFGPTILHLSNFNNCIRVDEWNERLKITAGVTKKRIWIDRSATGFWFSLVLIFCFGFNFFQENEKFCVYWGTQRT